MIHLLNEDHASQRARNRHIHNPISSICRLANTVYGSPTMAKIPNLDSIENQAIGILGFLASDAERLGLFLSLTGVDPADIRSLMKDQGFWLAIFDHLFQDESLMLVYCAEAAITPAELVRLRQSLARPQEEGLREG
jgi:hypothetical protein